MISCNSISKRYDNLPIFSNLSLKFESKGLYLLFGRSGSGKTTLLNILSGLVPFDTGTIQFDDDIYRNIVDNEKIMSQIAYITQNTYLVNYLCIYDNLKLCSNNEDDINRCLSDFNLDHTKNIYPDQLSGGEKEKIAIIQAILSNKKIFLLDEPTASLDKTSKLGIFNLLNKLKSNYLIIVSSHDEKLKTYADEIIDFENLEQYCNNTTTMHIENTIKKSTSDNSLKNQKLYKYMNKNFKYSKFEIRSSVILCLVFIFSIMACFACDTPINKLISSIDKNYHINQFQIICDKDNENICQKFINDNSYEKEVVTSYWKNLPQQKLPDGSSVQFPYETEVIVLPFNAKFFKVNNLLYGEYFRNINDILIDINKARELSNDIPSLIGSKITLDLYNGKQEFIISGIFNTFTDQEINYFNAIAQDESSLSNKYFINSHFMQNYFNETIYYDVYFEDFSSMYNVYLKYHNSNFPNFIKSIDEQYSNLMQIFLSISAILYPISIIVVIVSLLFYFQSMMLSLERTQYNYCVYNYYGYSLKTIIKHYIIVNLIHIIKLLLISFGIAFIVSQSFNYLNNLFNLVSFELFSFNIYISIIYITCVLLLSLFVSHHLSKRIRRMGWYQILQDSRDLL